MQSKKAGLDLVAINEEPSPLGRSASTVKVFVCAPTLVYSPSLALAY